MLPDDLAARHAAAIELSRGCDLCERRCRADRTAGQRGTCGVGSVSRVANELLHYGEELELIPSHAVYLTGCSFRCVFCMTGDLILRPNVERLGVPLDPVAFAEVVRRRQREGATNLNILGGDPSVNLPSVLALLRECPKETRLVFNSNMYYTEEQARLLEGVVAVYLADWKYGNDACAERHSGVKNYVAVVARNMMHAARTAQLIVRYLVMPGHNDCCFREVARYMARDLPGVPLSVLDPYVPLFRASKVKGMDRQSTRAEADEVRAIAREHGIEVRT